MYDISDQTCMIPNTEKPLKNVMVNFFIISNTVS